MRSCVLWIVLGVACSVEHRSETFTACERASDCPNNQACTNNLCVASGVVDAPVVVDAVGIDALGCPSQCTSCNLGTMTCNVDCAISPASCNGLIACPTGWNCVIGCTTTNSCRNGIDCSMAKSCEINCSGMSSCRNIACGPGPCNTVCSGAQSCSGVSCGPSCSCNVQCQNQQACNQIACTALTCNFNRGCSALLPNCSHTCP